MAQVNHARGPFKDRCFLRSRAGIDFEIQSKESTQSKISTDFPFLSLSSKRRSHRQTAFRTPPTTMMAVEIVFGRRRSASSCLMFVDALFSRTAMTASTCRRRRRRSAMVPKTTTAMNRLFVLVTLAAALLSNAGVIVAWMQLSDSTSRTMWRYRIDSYPMPRTANPSSLLLRSVRQPSSSQSGSPPQRHDDGPSPSSPSPPEVSCCRRRRAFLLGSLAAMTATLGGSFSTTEVANAAGGSDIPTDFVDALDAFGEALVDQKLDVPGVGAPGSGSSKSAAASSPKWPDSPSPLPTSKKSALELTQPTPPDFVESQKRSDLFDAVESAKRRKRIDPTTHG